MWRGRDGAKHLKNAKIHTASVLNFLFCLNISGTYTNYAKKTFIYIYIDWEFMATIEANCARENVSQATTFSDNALEYKLVPDTQCFYSVNFRFIENRNFREAAI